MKDPASILVFRIGGIGDLVTATPVLRALRRQFPQAHISLMAEETPSELVESSSWVDDILTDDRIYRCQNPFRLGKPENMARMYHLCRKIQQRDYDLFIELHRLIRWSLVLKPWFFAELSGADEKAGLDTEGRGFFLTRRVPDDPTLVRSQVDWFGDILDELGVGVNSLRPEVPLETGDVRSGREVLDELVGTNEPTVGLFLGANPEFPEKYWSLDRFVKLARWLNQGFNVNVVGFAGPQEQDRVHSFRSKTKNTNNLRVLTGQFPIRTVAGFIQEIDYLVSADTGPMHMGVALETPTLGIFGPSEWHWYGTYPEEYDFVRAGPPGSRRTRRKEPDRFPASMNDVSVELVRERFKELYENV